MSTVKKAPVKKSLASESTLKKELKNKDIVKAIKVYQAVKFDKRNETSFTIMPIPNKQPPKIEVHFEKNVVEVYNDNDRVFIPFANVAGIYMFTKADEAKIANAEAEANKTYGIRASEIKRPS